MKIYFEKPLQKALIKERKNRFIFLIEIGGEVVEAHCPATGIIAGLSRKDFASIDCLVSHHGNNPSRKTKYTVEAISLDHENWLGINQTKSNFYVEQFLKTESKIKLGFDMEDEVKRERKLNDSRIDFKVGNTYLEVKTLVSEFYGQVPDKFVDIVKTTTPSIERMNKHINSLAGNLKEGDRAIVLSVFQYNAPCFQPPVNEKIYQSFVEDLQKAKAKGLEHWQLNLKITENYVEILKVFRNEYLDEI